MTYEPRHVCPCGRIAPPGKVFCGECYRSLRTSTKAPPSKDDRRDDERPAPRTPERER